MKATKVTYTVQETPEKYQIDLTAEFDNGVSIGSRGSCENTAYNQKAATDTLLDFVNRVIVETERQLKLN